MLYIEKFRTIFLFNFKNVSVLRITLVVERIPCCAWTSNNLSFNHVNDPTLLVDRESKYIYQQITKCYGSYIWFLYLLLIQKSFVKSCTFRPNYKEKRGTVDWIQPILEINNPHTLPFQKRSIHQALHWDLLDLLLKYRY